MRKVIDAYQKFADFFYELMMVLCRILYIVMVSVIFYAVLGRFVFQRSSAWTHELGILCMVWICFITAALAIRDGSHIRMTLLEYIAPKIVTKILHCVAYFLLLALSFVLVLYGWRIIDLTMMARLPALQIPMSVLYASVFATGICGIVMSISRILRGEW